MDVPARPAHPRIPPVAEPTSEVAGILASTSSLRPDGPSLNIFTTLAHHPRLLEHFSRFGGFLLLRGLMPARQRELVVLRVAWRSTSVYEFGQHTVIGKMFGLTDEEIAAVCRNTTDGWNENDRLLIAMADEICDDDCISDTTWTALSRTWSSAQLLELLAVTGFYRLVAGLLNSVGVELDEGIPGWPENAEAPL